MKALVLLSLAAAAVYAEEGPRFFDPFALKNSSEMAITADFLAWQSYQNGLNFTTRSSSTSSVSHGKIESPDSEWGFGYRIGLDYKIPEHDQWDVALRYTYFKGIMGSRKSAPEGGALFPSWQFPTGAFVYADKARASWGCNLNIADLELGRNCFAGKWLSIRPFLGVRGAVIQQKFHIDYEGGTAVPPGDIDKISLSNNSWGVGLRLGFNSLWGLGKGFSFYFDGAGSLLSGNFKVHEREHLNIADVTRFSVSNNTTSVIPIAEIALGLQWDRYFSSDRFHFGMKLGWEMNYFFDQNRLIQFSSPGFFTQNNSDLGFMGLTLGFRFDF